MRRLVKRAAVAPDIAPAEVVGEDGHDVRLALGGGENGSEKTSSAVVSMPKICMGDDLESTGDSMEK